jgi:hypothetical protein
MNYLSSYQESIGRPHCKMILIIDVFAYTTLQDRRLSKLCPNKYIYADISQLVDSNVYPNKKTNQTDVTPSGWLSTVGPPGLPAIGGISLCSTSRPGICFHTN